MIVTIQVVNPQVMLADGTIIPPGQTVTGDFGDLLSVWLAFGLVTIVNNQGNVIDVPVDLNAPVQAVAPTSSPAAPNPTPAQVPAVSSSTAQVTSAPSPAPASTQAPLPAAATTTATAPAMSSTASNQTSATGS